MSKVIGGLDPRIKYPACDVDGVIIIQPNGSKEIRTWVPYRTPIGMLQYKLVTKRLNE